MITAENLKNYKVGFLALEHGTSIETTFYCTCRVYKSLTHQFSLLILLHINLFSHLDCALNLKSTYTALLYQYLKTDAIVLKTLHCHCGLFLELTNIIAIVMRFLVTCLWVWLIILCLPPTHHHDPSMTTVTGESPDTIRFASHALLDSYGVVVVDWKSITSLRLKMRGVYRVYPQKLYRVHRPVAAIITLLLTSGNV